MGMLMFAKKAFYDESGATSVLVIFMMIVLVALGAFVITSSHVNYKFSNKALDWNKTFYALDAAAEEYVSAVDAELTLAEVKAVAYISMGGYAQSEGVDIPEDLQSKIYREFQESTAKELSVKNALKQVYIYYVNENLAKLTADYPSSKTSTLIESDEVIAIVVETDIVCEDNKGGDKYLNVSIRVDPVDYSITFIDNVVSGKKNTETKRYIIENWYEWQAVSGEDDSILLNENAITWHREGIL